jgi:hypothetical protein
LHHLGEAAFDTNPGLLVPLTKSYRKNFPNQFKPYNGIFGCDLSATNKEVYDETLFRFPLRTQKHNNIFKILFLKGFIIINPQSLTLTFCHTSIEQAFSAVYIFSFVIKEAHLCCSCIICILNQFLWHGKPKFETVDKCTYTPGKGSFSSILDDEDNDEDEEEEKIIYVHTDINNLAPKLGVASVKQAIYVHAKYICISLGSKGEINDENREPP